MDKQSYETYEFLTSTSTVSDTNQFYVLQDDGTILTVNKEIQYIAQVQGNKQAVENLNSEECGAVFDVSSQNYYVDVESSTPEIISINDEFAVANGENNVYSTSYLVEAENNSETNSKHNKQEPTVDPLKLDSQQLQKNNIEAAKQTNDLTEITLTDEQYQILEQKGWLLMESNDRIFVLNTLGLHDITTNSKLIQKLKNELQDTTLTNTHIEQLKIETVTVDLPSEETDKAMQTQGNIVQYLVAKNMPIQHENTNIVENTQFISDDNNRDQDMGEAMELTQNSEIKSLAQEPMSISKLINNVDGSNSDTPKKCDSIKIKTKYTFTDIPDKIFLGKTVSGKKLYAKVTKKSSHNKKDKKLQEMTAEKKYENKPTHNNAILDGVWFTNLIQDSFRHFMTATDVKFVAVASAVVSQLVRLPEFKDFIVGTNLVVTKIITSETISGKEIGQPKMAIGTIENRDGENTFVHAPLLLHELLVHSDNNSKTEPDMDLDSQEEKTARDVIELVHIHISETRFIDKALQTSINLCKRKLPLDVLNDAKKKYPNPLYACGSCGVLFKSENLLKDHHNDQCIEVEDELTIDTSHADEFNSNETLYTVEVNGREKIYSCVICETKFTRLFNCQKHIKAHKTSIEKKLKVYKCKMCPSAFVHSSSLSKHIVKMHIQMQMN